MQLETGSHWVRIDPDDMASDLDGSLSAKDDLNNKVAVRHVEPASFVPHCWPAFFALHIAYRLIIYARGREGRTSIAKNCRFIGNFLVAEKPPVTVCRLVGKCKTLERDRVSPLDFGLPVCLAGRNLLPLPTTPRARRFLLSSAPAPADVISSRGIT